MQCECTSKGFCRYKPTHGIKRHLAVDRLGFPVLTHCTKANVTDDQGLIEMLSNNIAYFKAKPVNIPKITILVDQGYHPEVIRQSASELGRTELDIGSLLQLNKLGRREASYFYLVFTAAYLIAIAEFALKSGLDEYKQMSRQSLGVRDSE